MILLASSSPQRTALLREAGLAHYVIATVDDGSAVGAGPAQAIAIERARAKARSAQWQEHEALFSDPHGAIVAADTVASLGGRALGSPTTAEEARAMLGSLSGTRHTVITAHCCYRPALGEVAEQEAVSVALAHITMLPLTPAQVDAYVASGEGIGRAGGYALQGNADPFVAEISGDRDTVIGLHVASVQRLYREVTGHHPQLV